MVVAIVHLVEVDFLVCQGKSTLVCVKIGHKIYMLYKIGVVIQRLQLEMPVEDRQRECLGSPKEKHFLIKSSFGDESTLHSLGIVLIL